MELFNHVRRHDTLADVFLYNLVDLAELILLEILNQQIFFMSNNFCLHTWTHVSNAIFGWVGWMLKDFLNINSAEKKNAVVKVISDSQFWENVENKTWKFFCLLGVIEPEIAQERAFSWRHCRYLTQKNVTVHTWVSPYLHDIVERTQWANFIPTCKKLLTMKFSILLFALGFATTTFSIYNKHFAVMRI